jgi:hypothetical protein
MKLNELERLFYDTGRPNEWTDVTLEKTVHPRPEIVAALAAICEVWPDCSITVITPDRSSDHADLIRDLKAAGVSGRWRVES